MKFSLLFLCICLAAFQVSAQPGKTKSPVKKPATQTVSKKPADRPSTANSAPKKNPAAKLSDKAEFEKAMALEDTAAKVEALKSFVATFPKSEYFAKAKDALTSSAYALAEENLSVGEVVTAVEMYRLAIESAPTPLPVAFFNNSLAKVLTTLYWRGNRTEALDLVKILESKIGNDAEMLAALSTFYSSIENGEDAVRLAEAAVKADPTKSKGYIALGTALRVNFRLEDSAAAFAKAVELEPSSVPLKRSLAEIKRAIGKSDDAIALYREALKSDENDQQSRNGLVLALFDAGKTEDAEKELGRSLEANPNNVMLMAGVAYWYAAHKNGDRAIELSQKAIAIEPRYVWSHIALGRGLMLQNRPLEAEEVLLKARAYGNFPTLDYEIASARFMAGFYRDAVEGLQTSFSLSGDEITTKVGARVNRTAKSFADVLADERRASILQPNAADDADVAARLKELMIISNQLSAAKPDEAVIVKSADAFVGGDDIFKYHRQLYAASLLLNKRVAVDKALEYAQAAVGNADAALTAPNANAYVMASELYDSRQIALARGELIKVPDVSRQMLAAILRGRIEDLVGWALLQKEKPSDAAIRFKRAVSILPEKSAWWRASLWRLGSALQADGKEPEALDAYIKSYSIDKPDLARYTTVEALYKKLNGSTEGLEAKIGAIPLAQISPGIVAKNETTPKSLPVAAASPNTLVLEPTPTPSPTGMPAAATVTDDKKVEITPAASTEANLPPLKIESTPTPAATPEPTATTRAPSSAPELAPTPTVQPTATPTALPTLELTPSQTPTPEASPSPSPSPTPSATPTPEMTPAPTPDVTPTLQIKIEPAVAKSEPEPAPIAMPAPDEKMIAQVTKKTLTEGLKKEPPRSSPSATPKPLFEPIIITIPKTEIPNSSASAEKVQRPTLELVRPGPDTRPRVIITEPIQASEPSPCQISVSQEKLSLLNNGGTLSVLVGVDRNGSLGDIKYLISDPKDISVTREPDVSDVRGRALYVIRSISERTGNFRVTFYLSCGKKDLQITVR